MQKLELEPRLEVLVLAHVRIPEDEVRVPHVVVEVEGDAIGALVVRAERRQRRRIHRRRHAIRRNTRHRHVQGRDLALRAVLETFIDG